MLGYLEAQSWWRHQMETFSASLDFVRGIHRGPLMFALICVWINGWANNREAGDLTRHRAHYDVIVMWCSSPDPFMHWATYRQRFIYQLWHGCVIKPHSLLWDMPIHRGPNFNDALEKLCLTHLGRDNIDAISQTSFSCTSSWIKMFDSD